jgi:hypothetical protein
VLVRKSYCAAKNKRLSRCRHSDKDERTICVINEESIAAFTQTMRPNVLNGDGRVRRIQVRSLIDQIEIDDEEIRIYVRRTVLERPVMDGGAAAAGLPSSVRKWRAACRQRFGARIWSHALSAHFVAPRRLDDVIDETLHQGDDVFCHIETLMREEAIPAAVINGIGFTRRATFGLFDFETKTFQPKTIEDLELMDMNMAWKDGKPAIHAHGPPGTALFAPSEAKCYVRGGRGSPEISVTLISTPAGARGDGRTRQSYYQNQASIGPPAAKRSHRPKRFKYHFLWLPIQDRARSGLIRVELTCN